MIEPEAATQVVAVVSRHDVWELFLALFVPGISILATSLWFVSKWITRIESAIAGVIAINSTEHLRIVEKITSVGDRVTRVENRVDDHVNDHARWTK